MYGTVYEGLHFGITLCMESILQKSLESAHLHGPLRFHFYSFLFFIQSYVIVLDLHSETSS